MQFRPQKPSKSAEFGTSDFGPNFSQFGLSKKVDGRPWAIMNFIQKSYFYVKNNTISFGATFISSPKHNSMVGLHVGQVKFTSEGAH